MSRRYARRLLASINLPQDAKRLLTDTAFHDSDLFEEILLLCDQLHNQDPKEGFKLARIAPELAKLVDPYQLQPQLHLRGYAVLGAAHRILSQYEEAEAAFLQGEQLLSACPPLSQVDFLWRYAAVHQDRRRFDQAHAMVEQGMSLFRSHGDLVHRRLYGLLLVARALIYFDEGAAGKAAADLSESLNHFDPQQDQNYYYAALHNLAVALVEHLDIDSLGRALSRIRDARKSLSYHPQHFARWKLRWLEGLVDIRFGSTRQGERLLRRAREGLIKLELPFEVAVISLDLASLLMDEGRHCELAGLAAETYQLFASLSVDREAMAALKLWADAVQAQELTTKLTVQVRAELAKAAAGSIPHSSK